MKYYVSITYISLCTVTTVPKMAFVLYSLRLHYIFGKVLLIFISYKGNIYNIRKFIELNWSIENNKIDIDVIRKLNINNKPFV